MLPRVQSWLQSNEQTTVDEEELKQVRDDARCEAAVQTLKDILWRFDEIGEGNYNLYDLLGFVVEDLVREGCCGACVHETMTSVLERLGVDPTVHREDPDAVYH